MGRKGTVGGRRGEEEGALIWQQEGADKFWTPQSPVPSGVWHDLDLKGENTEVLSADRVRAGGHLWVPSSPRAENWTLCGGQEQIAHYWKTPAVERWESMVRPGNEV